MMLDLLAIFLGSVVYFNFLVLNKVDSCLSHNYVLSTKHEVAWTETKTSGVPQKRNTRTRPILER